MVCLSIDRKIEEFNFKELYDYVTQHLAPYARPLFLRLRPNKKENDKTATLKFQKHKYATEGFNPAAVGDDKIFFYHKAENTYSLLTSSYYDQITLGVILF